MTQHFLASCPGLRRAWTTLVLLPTIGACAAQQIVFRPTPEQRDSLRQPPLPYTVRVEEWEPGANFRNPRAYGQNAVHLLRKSHAFRAVQYARDSIDRDGGPPELIAQSTGDYCNTAIIPLYTILTVGLFPTIWDEQECSGIVFYRPGGSPSDGVVVRIRHRGKAVLGWAATPLVLLPPWNWSFHSAREQHSYHASFRLAVLRQQAEIARLASP